MTAPARGALGSTAVGRARLVALVAVATLALLAAACGDDDGGGDATPEGGTAVLPDPTPDTTTASGDDPGDDGATTTAPAADDGDGTTTTTVAAAVDSLDGAAVQLRSVARLDSPTALASRPGSPHLWIAERPGRVRLVALESSGLGEVRATVGPVVADVSDRTTVDAERGLLGLAFSADGDTLYLSYTDRAGHTNVDALDMDGDTAVAASRRQVLFTEQPFANHNGGHLAFGPDGFLYLGLGDGGGGGDPLDTGQDPTDLLGSLLRIDPRAEGDGYDIPADNPFVDGGGAAEVWAYGLRNPWRFSWDRATGDLWIADVGQNAVEEVTLIPADDGSPPGRGANLGWPILEGDQPYSGAPVPDGLVAPVLTYGHDEGCSITGGHVSRGDALAALRGAYVFADYCAAELRAALVRDGELVDERRLGVSVPGGQVVSFGEGPDGELYVLSLAGEVLRIDPA